jgi:hypothetical protein
MKLRILILATLLGAGLAAGDGGKKDPQSNPPASPAPSAPSVPIGPPKEAVEIARYTFRYTDAQGKVWIYRRTPFGWMKAERKDVPEAAPAAAALPETRVVEDGDGVRFERNTPFGMQRWRRKKSELTEQEKQIFERASRPAANAPSAKPASQE